jgi:hypothetical protein
MIEGGCAVARAAIALAVVVVLAQTSTLRSQSALFHAPTSIPVGAGSGTLALVDANGDGRLDLLTVHLLTRRIGVFLGDGRGGFTAASSAMTLDLAPGAMAHGDVTGDGRADLILASRDDSHEYIDLLAGDGRGSFRAKDGSRHVAAGAFRFYKPKVVLADVNGDGALDIVTGNGRRNTIEILRGDGRGAFSAAAGVTMEEGGDYYSWTVGDVDGDRHPDLVTTRDDGPRTAGRLTVRRGNGHGAFGPPLDRGALGAGPRIAALADVDGDARPDLVITHADAARLTILSNEGGGLFVPATSSPVDLVNEAFAVLVSDADRDGQADIVAATVNSRERPHDSSVTMLLGRHQVPAPGSPFRVGPGAYQLTAGDVDGDGKLDVLASSFEGDTVTLLRGR